MKEYYGHMKIEYCGKAYVTDAYQCWCNSYELQ